jgi:GNAT superfamily N-acetyltransferase
MESTPPLVTAVDHPSLYGHFERFLGELRSERPCTGRWTGRTPFPELIDQLASPRCMRLGVCQHGRFIAAVAVDNDGGVVLAVLKEYRRRGVASGLMEVAAERAQAIGYPPLHRFTVRGGSTTRMAG